MGSSMSHHSSNTPSTESIPADALAAILLRVPPHPTCLSRASVASKGLRGVITNPDFLRMFCKHHNSTPPLLGFFHNDGGLPSIFLPVGDSPDRVSAAAFDPMVPGWRVVDSRHVLLRSPDRLHFLVWEPMAGRLRYIDAPPPHQVEYYKFSNNNAALVCTTGHEEGHGNCHDCPLSILFVVTPRPRQGQAGTTVVYLYSSEQGLWDEVASGDFSPFTITERPVVLLRNVLYWTMAGVMGFQEGILAFELETQRLYPIGQPAYIFDPEHEHVQVMEMEDGRFGLVVASGLTLQLWLLLEYNGEGRERWVLDREIYLDADLAPPEPILEDYYLIWILGVQGKVVFLLTGAGIFELDLQTEESKRLCDGYEIEALYPYTSFYRQGRIGAEGGNEQN